MAKNSSTSNSSKSNSPKLNDKVKSLAWKGVVGALSLTATAAIPVMVQRVLVPPSAIAPASTLPAQVQPAAEEAQPTQNVQLNDESRQRRGRDKDRNQNRPEKH